jgi:large subunit ribosomal protein L6
MSRIGKKEIQIPSQVKARLESGVVYVEGPKGKLSKTLHTSALVDIDKDTIKVSLKDPNKDKNIHGLTRTLIANMVKGVSEGFKKTLLIQGVGYRAEQQGNTLVLSLGFSHQVNFPVPKEVTFSVKDRTQVDLESFDNQLLGQVAAEIRSVRPPEPYGGKGVRYSDEIVRRKEGKSGKK